VCAVLHYLWLAKKANPDPYYYAAALALLLAIRAGDWIRRRVARLSPSPRPRDTKPSPPEGERVG